jgi:membrane protease YdiL (CAAX protease family)
VTTERNLSSRSEMRALVVFYLLACAISWSIWAPWIAFPRLGDRLEFLLLVGAYGPLLAAIATTWIYEGRAGVWRWLKAAFKWRISAWWYLIGGVFINLAFALLHLGLYRLLGGPVTFSGRLPWYGALVIFPVSVFIGFPLGSGLGEEPGWRGYALPRLLARFHPLVANLILGVFWAAWHVPPLFFSTWTGSSQGILLFVYAIPLSVVMSWLYCKSSGSTIPVGLMHAGGNLYSDWFTTGMLMSMETVFVGSLALDFTAVKTVVYWAAAIVVIVATRGRLGYPARAPASVAAPAAPRVEALGETTPASS